MGTRGRPLGIFFEAFSEAIINLVKAIMWLVPFGIVFLVAHKILLTENLQQEFESLGWYIGTGATWTGHTWFYRSSGNICNLQETEPIHIHVFYVESISDSPSNRVQVSKTWI